MVADTDSWLLKNIYNLRGKHSRFTYEDCGQYRNRHFAIHTTQHL